MDETADIARSISHWNRKKIVFSFYFVWIQKQMTKYQFNSFLDNCVYRRRAAVI